jgi:hypothetical protein
MTDTGSVNVNADTASVTVEAKHPAPPLASVVMPDHPVRNTLWYQLMVRLARPTLDWIGNIGAAYVLFLGHWIGKPMPEAYAGLCLLFVGGLYGVRTFEKKAGVA